MLSDRPAEVVAATSPGHVAGQEAAARPNRASWVGVVVLLDYVAAFLTFAAAGGYLILKALNDQQSALMRVIELTARWFYYLGIHEMPGLPSDYRTLRIFSDPFLANAYMITMAALHLLASAGFMGLAVALGGFRPWARRAHLLIAALAMLLLGAYAYVVVASPAPENALMAIAAFAVVPAAVLAILMTPRVAALFAESPRAAGQAATRPQVRATRRFNLILTLIMALYVLGVLVTVLVVSVPVALSIHLALTPAQ